MMSNSMLSATAVLVVLDSMRRDVVARQRWYSRIDLSSRGWESLAMMHY